MPGESISYPIFGINRSQKTDSSGLREPESPSIFSVNRILFLRISEVLPIIERGQTVRQNPCAHGSSRIGKRDNRLEPSNELALARDAWGQLLPDGPKWISVLECRCEAGLSGRFLALD